MNKNIHIVCLDAPSPPDYGGAIDMFYKIKALHDLGYNITLHYFDYNPLRHAHSLEPYCTAFHTYQRKTLFQSLPLTSPYIIRSRINKKLIKRLNSDNDRILLEGLHCAGIIPFLRNKKRIVLRMHNEESSYYHQLAKMEKAFLKKTYFQLESRLLHHYQRQMDKEIQLACISQTDIGTFVKDYGFTHTHFIPCFMPWQRVNSKEGLGTFCLYHGNLTVSENEEAASWLIENVFSKVQVPFVIAGKGISKNLALLADHYQHIAVVNNPTIPEIDKLVQEAQINVLPSMNRTGVKLKLLNALLNGRHCVTNYHGIAGSNIQKGVIIEDSVTEWIKSIGTLMNKEFSFTEKKERAETLALYNNQLNAQKLSALWTHYQ